MPLYDFVCESCDRRFEDLVRRDEIPECPQCGSAKKVERQLPVFAVKSGGGAPSAPEPCRPCGDPRGPGS